MIANEWLGVAAYLLQLLLMRISETEQHQKDSIAEAEEVLVNTEVRRATTELPDAEVTSTGNGQLKHRSKDRSTRLAHREV